MPVTRTGNQAVKKKNTWFVWLENTGTEIREKFIAFCGQWEAKRLPCACSFQFERSQKEVEAFKCSTKWWFALLLIWSVMYLAISFSRTSLNELLNARMERKRRPSFLLPLNVSCLFRCNEYQSFCHVAACNREQSWTKTTSECLAKHSRLYFSTLPHPCACFRCASTS